MKKLSIGMPLYNASLTLDAAIQSILNQNFKDFELIISDNNSTDNTYEICKKYAKKDSRIILFKQSTNIGGDANFVFVYKEAKSEYFSWAAADDTRTDNFFEKNIQFLENNLDYSFSSSTNCFIGQENNLEKHFNFIIDGDVHERIIEFFNVGMKSHACFYSVFRRIRLIDYFNNKKTFHFPFDWEIDLNLLVQGKFGRINGELLVLGYGVSAHPDVMKKHGNNLFENLFPYFNFSISIIKLIYKQNNILFINKFKVFYNILIFNIKIYKIQLKNKIKSFVKNILK